MSFSDSFLSRIRSLVAALVFSSVFLFQIGRSGRARSFLFANRNFFDVGCFYSVTAAVNSFSQKHVLPEGCFSV